MDKDEALIQRIEVPRSSTAGACDGTLVVVAVCVCEYVYECVCVCVCVCACAMCS